MVIGNGYLGLVLVLHQPLVGSTDCIASNNVLSLIVRVVKLTNYTRLFLD